MVKRKNKEQAYFVIAASVLPRPGTGGGYEGSFYGRNGERVREKYKAAIFLTWDEAKEFADKRGIELGQAIPYIERVYFTEHEMNMLWRYEESMTDSPSPGEKNDE